MIELAKAAILTEIGKPLEIKDLALPELKPGQVMVDIAYSGVCGSQLNEARGRRGPDAYIPHTLGHEGSGIVVGLGPDVTKVEPGDRVVLSWIKGAGADIPGTIYLAGDTPVNSGAISTFMTRTVVSENRLTIIPDQMPLREAALLGCAVPTGGGMIKNTLNVGHENTVAVFGVGGVGTCAVMMAKFEGAKMIIAVDVSDEKLARAKAFGATHVINAGREDAVESVQSLTNGGGVDYAIEAAGSTLVAETAFASVRAGGGTCIIAGNPPAGDRVSLDPFDLIRGKQIFGSWGGGSNPDLDIPYYAEAFIAGKLDLSALISQSYALDGVNQALADLEAGRVGRALLDFELNA